MGSACCAGRDVGTNCGDKTSHSTSEFSRLASSRESKRKAKSRNRSMMTSPLVREEEDRPPRQPGDFDSEQREKIRLAARSLVLEIPVSPKHVSESWLSPLTCEGAALAASLCDIIRMNSKSVTFRSYIKLVVIQEEVIPKLLTNLKSSDQSLRLISVHLLSFLVVPSQYELTRLFINSDGLRKLKSLVGGEHNEGLIAATMQVALAVFTTGTEFHPQVYDVLPTIIKRLKHMRTAGHLLTTLESFTELIRLKPDQPSHNAIIDCGLGESLRELKRSIAAGEVRAETIPQMVAVQQTIEGLAQWTGN